MKGFKRLFFQFSILSSLVLVHWWPHWSKYRLTSPRHRRAGPHSAVEVMEVLRFLLAAMLASIASPSPSLLQSVQPRRLQMCSCPALVPSLGPVAGRGLELAMRDGWGGKQGWGWDMSACWGGGLWWGRRWGQHLWGLGGSSSWGNTESWKMLHLSFTPPMPCAL